MFSDTKRAFFKNVRALHTKLTFDDVLGEPAFTTVQVPDVITESMFSKNISVKVPIISAAMDTVTEANLAIAIAKVGGLGIIHRNLSIEEQVEHVRKVKNYSHGLVSTPAYVLETDTVGDVLERKERGDLKFSSFPVLNGEQQLVGLITKTNLGYAEDPSARIGAIMTPLAELVTAEAGTTKEDALSLMQQKHIKLLLLVKPGQQLAGMYTQRDLMRARFGSMYNVDDSNGQLIVGAAVGFGDEGVDRAHALIAAGADVIVADSAHIDAQFEHDTIQRLLELGGADIVAGNVSTAGAAVRLAKLGVHGIKVGQGGGSICTTRVVTGFGTPQVSAIYDCAEALSDGGYDIPVCADGGIRHSGDIVLALMAGGSTVMLGGLLAGTAEAPGDVKMVDGKPTKEYRGMGSIGAMKKRFANDRYRGDEPVAEGVEGQVQYRGTVQNAVKQYIGGLKKGMREANALTINDLWSKAEFCRVTSAGVRESHPHDLIAMTSAPNYEG